MSHVNSGVMVVALRTMMARRPWPLQRPGFTGLLTILVFVALALMQNDKALSASADSLSALSFLEGTWDAHAKDGSAGAQSTGKYTFRPELKHHVLVRSSEAYAACKGPKSFNCEHSDVLYIYQEAGAKPLRAIYFDNEGHVIHYDVSTPDSATAVFLSAASSVEPQFRLVYELKNQVMSGKFQIRLPGQEEWKSYLEWSGAKR
jgi:hypothetical protein